MEGLIMFVYCKNMHLLLWISLETIFSPKENLFFLFYGHDVHFNVYTLMISVKIVVSLLCPTLLWACSFRPLMHDAAVVPSQTRSSILHLRVVLVLWDGAKGSSLVTHLQPQNLCGIFPWIFERSVGMSLSSITLTRLNESCLYFTDTNEPVVFLCSSACGSISLNLGSWNNGWKGIRMYK